MHRSALAHHGLGFGSAAARGEKRKAVALSIVEDSLGKLASRTAASVQAEGWESFVRTTRGASNVSQEVGSIQHKAAWLFEHLRVRGASLVMSTPPPWDKGTWDAVLQRGPHKLAQLDREFVFEEILAVLPYSQARVFPSLRTLPLGVVP
jgi:hypothetical protein